MIRNKPSMQASRYGYLRLGGIAERGERPVGTSECKRGWYEVKPRGFACLDDDGTLERDDPIVRAASRRPLLNKPMPYAYGFVRAVLPLYLRIPNKQRTN